MWRFQRSGNACRCSVRSRRTALSCGRTSRTRAAGQGGKNVSYKVSAAKQTRKDATYQRSHERTAKPDGVSTGVRSVDDEYTACTMETIRTTHR